MELTQNMLKIGEKPMTLDEVLMYISEYNIKHIEFPLNLINKKYTRGLVVLKENEKTIYLTNDLPLPYKCQTMLHELYHIRFAKNGELYTPEDFIDNLAKRDYRIIFKAEPPE